MSNPWVIVGAGIGGLGSALALGLKGLGSVLHERSLSHSEVGAGIQLGPNALRRLQTWGLMTELERVASSPKAVEVHDWSQSQPLARMPLGKDFKARYGLPYLTLHRGDLHALLMARVNAVGQTEIHLDSLLQDLVLNADSTVSLHFAQSSSGERLPRVHAQALLGCDGIFSTVRQTLWPSRVLNHTGHIAYRAMVAQQLLPPRLRSESVQMWMGPGKHWVQYPILGSEWLNVVVLIETCNLSRERPLSHLPWQVQRTAAEIEADFERVLMGASPVLREISHAVSNWGAWQMWDAQALDGPDQMARGSVALLGDAAHPMLPYLAQAAAMAIEDAQSMAECASHEGQSVAYRMHLFAKSRWQRNSRMQSKARLQSNIYHAQGALGWARNVALKSLGQRIMQMPWIYKG